MKKLLLIFLLLPTFNLYCELPDGDYVGRPSTPTETPTLTVTPNSFPDAKEAEKQTEINKKKIESESYYRLLELCKKEVKESIRDGYSSANVNIESEKFNKLEKYFKKKGYIVTKYEFNGYLYIKISWDFLEDKNEKETK